jgi:long-chain acyl-CoA synthetase
MGTVGIPLPGVEIKFLEDGEILAKGDNIMKGYFKRPDLTAEVIDSEGWLHTGDIGEIVDGKFLKITDRKKELFKTSGGKYVAPQPIENKLKESRFIEQAMLVGDNKKYVSALIVPSFIALKAWADDSGLSFDTNEEAISNPKVVELMNSEVEHTNRNFGSVEKIKKIKILPAEWTIESGELTPTLKVKRKTILKHYEQIVESMYAE